LRNPSWRQASVGMIFSSREHENPYLTRALAWPFAAASSAMLCLFLVLSLSKAMSQPTIAVHILEAHVRTHGSVYVDDSHPMMRMEH
jgi:hypothetical protein